MSAISKPPRRQIFVLTTEEKKTIVFILCALVLGLATKHYRDTHPHAPRALTPKEQHAEKKATRLQREPPSPMSTGSTTSSPPPKR